MLILAVDTASEHCSAVLAEVSANVVSVRAIRSKLLGRGHAEALLPMIAACLEEAGIAACDVDRFAATVGPGTYTGIRVGVAAVRGLALATGCPAVGVSCLKLAGAPVATRHGGPVIAALKGRHGDVFAQVWSHDQLPLSNPMAGPPARLAEAFMSGDADPSAFPVAGSGAADWRTVFTESVNLTDGGAPFDLDDLARFALTEDPSVAVEPLYLRGPDAAPQTGKALPHADQP
ncbi:MAG: tRNA (adenosine(37)-N6)-threonylcarbamoyltransferase complex dimerization subunit type 1 TsaB [Pseudomonadota bacterium]